MANNNNNDELTEKLTQVIDTVGILTNNVNTLTTAMGAWIQNQPQQNTNQPQPQPANAPMRLFSGTMEIFDLQDPTLTSIQRSLSKYVNFYRANSQSVPPEKILQIWSESLTDDSKKTFARKRVECELTENEKKFLLNVDRPPGDTTSSTLAQYLTKHFTTTKMFEVNFAEI